MIGRHVSISLSHLALYLDGATHRVDNAGELEEQAVARGFDNAAAMFLDFGVGQLAPERFQGGEGPFLVNTP